MPGLALDLQTWTDRGAVIIELAGDLDVYSAPRLRDELDHLPRDLTRGLVVEMSGLEFLDSTGLGVLVGAAKRAKAAGGTVALAGCSDRIARVLEITGLTKVFALHAAIEDALAGLPAR